MANNAVLFWGLPENGVYHHNLANLLGKMMVNRWKKDYAWLRNLQINPRVIMVLFVSP